MSMVCGKRSFFGDIDSASSSPTSASPPPYKKFRCSSSTSPGRFTYSPPVQTTPVDELKALFPGMEIQLLEKALEESGNNLDVAINNLQELCLAHSNGSGSTAEADRFTGKGGRPIGEDAVALEEPKIENKMPANGEEWVDLFVKKISSATSIDEAKSRAATILEILEKSISSTTSAQAAQSFHKENVMVKEQLEAAMHDNAILKRAVAIQHERQKEIDERNQQVQQLRQLVAQYQEQLRNLEVNNYALQMHLRQAQQSNSIPGRFHPDIF